MDALGALGAGVAAAAGCGCAAVGAGLVSPLQVHVVFGSFTVALVVSFMVFVKLMVVVK